MRKQISLAIGLALALGSGVAADPSDDWSGFYAGGALSFSKAESTITGNRFTYNQNQAVNLVEHAYQGGGLSGFVGWNARRGNLVYGGELALGWDDLGSNLVFNSDNDIDNVDVGLSGSLAGRIGVLRDRTLFYAKGGLAFANFKNIGGDVNGGMLTLSDAHIRDAVLFGPTVSIGLEHLIQSNWSVRAEFSYTDFQEFSQANQDGAPGSQVYQISNGPIQKISVGFAYHF